MFLFYSSVEIISDGTPGLLLQIQADIRTNVSLLVVASWRNSNEKGRFAAAGLVAGAGFEPATFGL